MRMKISLALGKREGLTRQTARGCVATNIALPGFGSLMAGRAIGYAQAVLTIVSFVLTLFFGGKFILWYLANFSNLNGPDADPFETWPRIWLNIRWAVLGMGLFAVSWLWSLATNAAILRDAEKTKPPRLS